MEPLLSLKHVSKTFPVGKTILGKPDKFVHAVNDVSFDVYKGETFSIVGESGCGKSTTGRLINHLLTPDSGEIKFMGQEISHLTQALLSAVPIPDPGHKKERIILEGDIPSTINLPKGCPFAARCKKCMPQCLEKRPQTKEVAPGHLVACHLYDK